MKVILDSSIIMSEKFHFDTANTQQLLKSADILDIDIVVPAVVVEEIKTLYERDLDEKITNYRKAHNELNAILEDRIPDATKDMIASTLAFHFGGRFENGLKRMRSLKPTFRVADFPTVPHKEAVIHATRRRKPFAEKKDGYRDYLIWETVLEEVLAQPHQKPVYFLSSNKSDFAQNRAANPDSGPLELHSDLTLDMGFRGIPSDAVVYYASLSTFVREVVNSHLTSLRELAATVTRREFVNPELYSAIPLAIESWLSSQAESVPTASLQLTGDITSVLGGRFTGQMTIESTEVRSLPEGELTVLMRVTASTALYAGAPANSDFAKNLDDERRLFSDEDTVLGIYRKDLRFFVNALVGKGPEREIIRVDATLITPPPRHRPGR